jgi:hypothetical protein
MARQNASPNEEAVLRVFARLANHEALQRHPERVPLECVYCELAQMFENMMVGQLKAASEEAGRQIATAARASESSEAS